MRARREGGWVEDGGHLVLRLAGKVSSMHAPAEQAAGSPTMRRWIGQTWASCPNACPPLALT